jgi:ubiquinone/menaquinone biosynthesis C-methylase UbiE
MRFNEDILSSYVSMAPLALAFERILECQIYQGLPFERPVLDVGCGEGLFAKMLFAEQVDTGIDPDPGELDRARQLGAYDELIQCKGDAIPKPDRHFRTVFSNSVLEHIEDIEPVFREVYRVLAPGGRFHFTVPSHRFEEYTVANQVLTTVGLEAPAARFRKFFNSFWKHYHAYPEATWAGIAEKAGFTVVESFTYDPKRIAVMNDFLAPFGAGAFVLKRLLNRWVLAPSLRKVTTAPLQPLWSMALKGGERTHDGGLVLVSVEKAARQ